ncbi:MAG TPA: hypothetical protein VMS31_12770 [Pyrinomonadaceae bacterium]|nr:hypothetical protein [Pyrinomonadaceae bacterium]
MKKTAIFLSCAAVALAILAASVAYRPPQAARVWNPISTNRADAEGGHISDMNGQVVADRRFEVQIMVNGRPLEEYFARGKSYVEAISGAEYEVRIRNPLPFRVAVALSVDGLNTIDARRTTAWNASKWVIEPYGAINIGGWQMSSERARRFYFTSERDSYGAKLGQTSNLGVVQAVFFRERRPIPVPVTPRPRPTYEEDGGRDKSSSAPTAGARNESLAKEKGGDIAPAPDDDYAATGIGRSVHNDVRWVNLELESRPAAEVTIRYEYYPALVRLGIVPRTYNRPDTLRRREGATGFDDRRFSPEP